MIGRGTAGVVLAALLAASAAGGQDSDEVKRLKARVELLEAKLEAANLKIEKLEAENQRLAKGGGKEAGGQGKQKYTDRFNVNEEAEYVLEKVARNGREVTLDITATLTKGPERRTITYFGVNMVDADGNSHKARVNAAGNKAVPERVDLRAGIATKMQIRFPLAEGVTKLQTAEVTMSAVERVAIKFSNVEVPK